MTSSGGSGGPGFLDPSGRVVGAAIDALPPDIQALVRPGKTSERIQHAITWASRRDPAVVRRHHARDRRIQRFEDIQSAPLRQMDAVAREIAASYRRRALLTGAATGLPGGLWALVAAGADVQLTAIYAVRMAAQVAQAYGYDTSALEEQAHLADVLALVAGVDTLRGVGNYLTRQGLAHLIPDLLPRLLARVSVEITREQAAKWVGRLIPGVGAVVGGAIDYGFLRAAGHRALDYYHSRYVSEHQLGAPAAQQALPPAAAAPRVVEGSLSAPPAPQPPDPSPATPGSALSGSALSASPGMAPGMVPARPAVAPAPLERKLSKPPEHFARYLIIFAILALLVTLMACGALAVLAYNGIAGLLPR
ncbi:MAG: EcsC family protein [Ktedonobacterales bacterium]|nr:EcsC family protein [Ktedonobacterales bacterium]